MCQPAFLITFLLLQLNASLHCGTEWPSANLAGVPRDIGQEGPAQVSDLNTVIRLCVCLGRNESLATISLVFRLSTHRLRQDLGR